MCGHSRPSPFDRFAPRLQDWREPFSHSPLDIAAAQARGAQPSPYSQLRLACCVGPAAGRAQAALEGQLSRYADPIFGKQGVHDYPDSMKRLLRYGMPSISATDQECTLPPPPRLATPWRRGVTECRACRQT